MELPPLPDPMQPVVMPNGLVDEDWYRWFQAFQFYSAQLAEQITDAEGKISNLDEAIDTLNNTVIADSWVHFIPYVENDTPIVVPKLPWGCTITSCVTDADSGTCIVRPRIDGVSVGTANNSVSTTEVEVTYSTANVAAAGQTIDYVISSNASCRGARIQINYRRRLI